MAMDGPHQVHAIEARETLRSLISDHWSDILELVEEHYGSRDVPVVIGYCDPNRMSPLKHDISVKLPLRIKDYLAQNGAIGYVQAVDDMLSELYAISEGHSEDLDGCKATWALSKIPLFVEFRFRFDGDDNTWSFHLHIDSVVQDDMDYTAKVTFKLARKIRENHKGSEAREDECNEAMSALNIGEESKSEASELLKQVTDRKWGQSVQKHTKSAWADLLALKDDPLDDYPRWWERHQDLAVAANVHEVDLSLFDNFDRLAEARYKNWCEKHKDSVIVKSSAGTKKKSKKKKNKKKKTAVVSSEIFDKPACLEKATNSPGDGHESDLTVIKNGSTGCEQSLSSETAQTDSPKAVELFVPQQSLVASSEDQSQPNLIGGPASTNNEDTDAYAQPAALEVHEPEQRSQDLFPTVAELMDNLPPPTPIRRSSSHRGFFGSQSPYADPTPQNPDVPSAELEDMSDDEVMVESPSEVVTPRRASGHETAAYQEWALEGMWIYINETTIEAQLLPAHIKPFLKPRFCLPKPEAMPQEKLPVFVRRARVTGKEPKLEYDPTWHRTIVTPQTEVVTDLRQLKVHVDWLPPWKLQEYQAVEMAGVIVWRHDRAFLPCLLPDCYTSCRDHDFSTQLCLGCGPRSTVRYCSKEHQRLDLEGHWEECGHEESVIPHWVDIETQPKRFNRRYPAIDDVENQRSKEKFRQRAYYIWNGGHYTVFYPEPRKPVMVTWPSVELQAKYGPRVERCMNAAFHDEGLKSVIEHLYILVRKALRLSGQWRPNTIELLYEQFKEEFDWECTQVGEEDPCECTWMGTEADTEQCTRACLDLHGRLNIDIRRAGIKDILEKLESNSWLLRIWQRQHPTIRSWRRRLTGEGFPGARVRNLDEERPLMGRLWGGFGDPDVIGGWENIN